MRQDSKGTGRVVCSQDGAGSAARPTGQAGVRGAAGWRINLATTMGYMVAGVPYYPVPASGVCAVRTLGEGPGLLVKCR
jgi:hypothetical protein